MDEKIILSVIIFVILFSLQYTLNNILKVLREIRELLKNNSNKFK